MKLTELLQILLFFGLGIARLRRKLEAHGGTNLIRAEGGAGYSLSLAADHECIAAQTDV